jgi:hypothetical protein
VIVVEPGATDVARPLDPPALLIVATPAIDELQVTAAVRFCDEPSEYVPVAVNCRVVPLAMLGLAGVTARDTSVAGVTVRVVEPAMLPNAAVIVVEPGATDAAKPLDPAALLIVAAAVLEELQAAAAVRFCVVLSEYVPVAVNCRVVPLAMPGLVGVTARDTSVAGVTVRVVEAVMLPDAAVIVVEPAAVDVATPLNPAVLLTLATAVADELQVTDLVRSCVVLSEYVPVAVNCRVVPLAMLGLVGVTARDTSVAGVTVRMVEPVMLPNAAVIVVWPAAAHVARPLEPAALLTVATAVADELQVTVAVRSCVVVSENVPVAVKCWVVPLAMLGLTGVTAMDTSVAGVTVRVVEAVMFPAVAVIVALPTALPFALICPGLLTVAIVTGPPIVATVVSDETQDTDAVRSCVVLSE